MVTILAAALRHKSSMFTCGQGNKVELRFSCQSYNRAKDYRHTTAESSRKLCGMDLSVF